MDGAMSKDFVEQVRKDLIPKGSTVPHPPEWKGNNAEEGVVVTGEIPGQVKITRSDKKVHRRKIDPRKAKALTYMLQGYSKRQSMLKAGYSTNVASKPTEWLSQKSIQSVLASMQDKFISAGITPEFIAAKMKEWLSAEKTIATTIMGTQIKSPDYDTQLKAFDKWKGVVGPTNPTTPGKTRKLTLEEFVWGGESNAGE